MIGIPTGPTPPPTLRSIWSDCLSYWEFRRLIYNGILTFVVVTQLTSLHAWPLLATPKALLGMIVAIALANLCYCSAYVVDLAVQHSNFRETWLRGRGTLFGLGCILGAALTAITLPLVLQGLQ